MKKIATVLLLAGSIGVHLPTLAAGTTATFDDMVVQPPLDGVDGLYFANGNSFDYAGVTWGPGFRVVGDQVRIDSADPLYGRPHSGHYFLTNEGDGVTNDQRTITTTLVLTGAWFGRNEYYGFGGGSNQVTIHAMGAGGSILKSLSFDLPELLPAEPEVLTRFDTAAFASLTGITGYRIDRREIGTQQGNWVADDFTFVTAAPVPEPGTYAMLLAGLGALAWMRRKP